MILIVISNFISNDYKKIIIVKKIFMLRAFRSKINIYKLFKKGLKRTFIMFLKKDSKVDLIKQYKNNIKEESKSYAVNEYYKRKMKLKLFKLLIKCWISKFDKI